MRSLKLYDTEARGLITPDVIDLDQVPVVPVTGDVIYLDGRAFTVTGRQLWLADNGTLQDVVVNVTAVH